MSEGDGGHKLVGRSGLDTSLVPHPSEERLLENGESGVPAPGGPSLSREELWATPDSTERLGPELGGRAARRGKEGT